jgi:hypothetical protein
LSAGRVRPAAGRCLSWNTRLCSRCRIGLRFPRCRWASRGCVRLFAPCLCRPMGADEAAATAGCAGPQSDGSRTATKAGCARSVRPTGGRRDRRITAKPRPVAVQPATNQILDLGAERDFPSIPFEGCSRRRTAGRRAGPPAVGGAAGRACAPPPRWFRRPSLAPGPVAVSPGDRVTQRTECWPAATARPRSR